MQKFHVADVGGSRRDQPIENLADLVDLPDRDVDLVGDAEAGQSLLGAGLMRIGWTENREV
jgi:hypothetical protein